MAEAEAWVMIPKLAEMSIVLASVINGANRTFFAHMANGVNKQFRDSTKMTGNAVAE